MCRYKRKPEYGLVIFVEELITVGIEKFWSGESYLESAVYDALRLDGVLRKTAFEIRCVKRQAKDMVKWNIRGDLCAAVGGDRLLMIMKRKTL